MKSPHPIDAYPLAAIQGAMLVNHIRAQRPGVDVVQMVSTLAERVDPDALKSAWETVVARHPALRTAFRWEDVPEPRQEVHADTTVPFAVHDWTAAAAPAVESRWASLMLEDRGRGFDLREMPLQRVTLVKLSDASWRLIWTFHHILIDGRAFAMVLREIFAEYDAVQSGVAAAAPGARRSYHDFVDWYRRQDFSKNESAWRERLRGFPGPTPLPAAFHAPTDSRAGRGLHARMLDATSTAALERLATATGSTMNTVVQAAWALLIARHSGESDVVFGATRACRKGTIDGADDIVGLFINTLPVRVRMQPEQPITALLAEVRQTWRSMFEIEHTPTQLVQKWSEVGPTTPLFESQIVFETLPLDKVLQAGGGAMATRGFHLYGATNFPLTGLIFGGEQLSLEIENDRDRIDDATARRVLDHLATILEQLAAKPDATVAEIGMLPASEREVVLRAWNDTDVSYPDRTLVDLLVEQAARTPNAVAVCDEVETLTYAELDSATSALARRLRAMGVGRGVLVGVCAERSVELVIALHAVVKAGGAYVPLDPEYPSDRLAFMVDDAGAPVLLASESAAKTLPPSAATIVTLEGVAATRDSGEPLPRPGTSDAAYMIYTSGSTGRPKGALNAHAGIVNRVLWMQREYELDASDVVLQKTPFSFDVSVWEFFWPFIAGAKLVMAKPGGHRDTSYLVDVITKRGVTVLHFVPSMLRAFLSDANVSRCATLRDVMASGEALTPDLSSGLHRALPNATLNNLYGPTECAVDVTYWECPRSVEPPPVVPIGRPVSNTQMYVLDERGDPAPIGVAGELFIAGVQVGLGYHNRPELTAERFVKDPFSPKPGARMYKTGDKARWRPDGTIEYLGRLDFQVKIRGFRIELGEIETTLAKHHHVREAVVVARDARLVAYIVAEGQAPAVGALREHLLTTLPDYMVPATFMVLPGFPLSSNGKVDRRALPSPEIERAALSRAYVAPRGEVERTLADIWAQVLRVDQIGVDDNFFELGGDSLLSVQIVARARAAGVQITIMQVMRHPTVAGLATVAGTSAAAVAIDTADVAGAVSLSPIQQWFFESQSDDAHYWNQTFLFTVPAEFDTKAFGDALAAVVEHHDSFRLRFTRGADGWRQTCAPHAPAVEIETVDLAGLAEGTKCPAIIEASVRWQSSFDLETGPTIRVGHFRNAGRPGAVVIAVHHLAIDGVSWRVLREDLETAYTQRVRGETISLPPRSTPFGQWASRLSAVRDRFRGELPYWEQIGTPAALRLPLDAHSSEPDVASFSDTVTVRLDERETRALLQNVPKAYNTQINDALLAALAESLGAWVGGGDIVVNVEGHGREDVVDGADLSRTTGWFTTLFPVRLSLDASDVGARLKQTKEMLRAVPNRGIGYGMLRYLDGAETLRAQNTPEIVFNYLGQFDHVLAGSQVFGFSPDSTGSWYGPRSRRPHRLEINALVIDDKLELRWTFNTRVHRRETIARVADEYTAALRGVVAHCTAPNAGGYTPSDFPLARVSQTSLDRVVGARRDVEDLYPVVPMQRLFLGFAEPATDPGFEQWRYRLRGTVDRAALRAAWEMVVARHSILRTAFVSDGDANPLQMVSRSVELPWAEHDLRTLSSADQDKRIGELLAADRAAGFAFDRAPLMRITIIRLGDDLLELVWSNHHLLLDRWSWPLILRELSRAYPAITGGGTPQLDDAPRYGEFVAWQQRQSLDAARELWTRHFADFHAPPRLVMTHPDALGDHVEVSATLTDRETRDLHAFARAHRIAANTVIEGAWALWVARRARHDDVSFGVSVAGRDGGVSGIDRMVGLTLNNLPVRVRVVNEAPVREWLQSLHEAQAEVQQFSYTPLDRVQEWSGVPWRTRLFETLLVFQHDDAEQQTKAWLGDGIATDLIHVPTRTAYPLSVMIAGGDAIALRVTYDPRYFDATSAREAADGLRDAIVAIVRAPAAQLAEILAQLPEPALAAADEARHAEYVAPRTATESVLAGLWSEVLGVERIGLVDDFFALGGYSLVATQIASRVRATLQVDMPVRLLFQHPTVGRLAAALKAADRTPGRLERVAQVVQRVNAMSLDEVRQTRTARAGVN
jgi:amino acid adenylation domain-containing protein/non-ribosomal peptide synthase protein (TIGR01720 family)